MGKKEFTEIVCIIDRSGSMQAIVNDAIGGFNTFLEDQKKHPGEATLTYIQFDTEYELLHENTPIKDVRPIDMTTYKPRGMTALLDAIGRTIDTVGRRLSNIPDENRPAKVVVAILTDGEENSSHEFTLEKVKGMITHQKDTYQWEFIFLAANQDAFAEGAKIGIDPKDIQNFAATGKGVRAAYAHAGASVGSYRTK